MISDDKYIYCKKEEIYLIMSSAKKLKQIRNGHRSHIKRLVGDINGFKKDIVHLKAIQNNIASKISVIKDLDEEILEAIDEDDENLIDAEIEDSSVFQDFYFENILKN